MVEIEYIGEHIWMGQLGQFLIFLAFASAILSTVSYTFGTNEQDDTLKANWLKIGRASFITHGTSIITIIVLLFSMMISKHYEYDYVWSHVSNSLPFKYTFAAFWEGQEGSFLLWMFWHSILGFVLIRKAKEWEQPVMAVISFAQVFFVFFILGLYVDCGDVKETSFAFLGNIYGRSGFVWALLTGIFTVAYFKGPNRLKTAYKFAAFVPSLILMVLVFSGCYHLGEMRIGASPFMLLRDVHFAPIFNTPDYIKSLEGTGLNPLLQNYWMTIHPPTLFLGFASTTVPCAFAIAGLWTGDHKGWMEPCLKWALFSGAILGTGIFMGGVWAYEALSFGGYWAWDPVENASLVPWITLIAGIHTTLVARSTGYSTKSSYIFYILTFFLIVYSTFLTRSGILGETSVHAFTEMGLEWQMILFMGAISALAFGFYYTRRKEIPAPVKEESGYSREFWMFVGALILLFSAGLITVTTSIPVINAIASLEPFDSALSWLCTSMAWDEPAAQSTSGGFNSFSISIQNFFYNLHEGALAPPEDVVTHHNNFQLWIGVLIAFFSGLVQFLAYNKEDLSGSYAARFVKYNLSAFAGALVFGLPLMYMSGILAWQYWLLVIVGLFSVISNTSYLIGVLKGNMKMAGSSLSHIGFGLMLVGVVFSGALKHPLSDPFASEDLNGLLGDLNKQTDKNILVPYGQSVQLSDGYTVSYTKTWAEGNAQYFELNFIQKDKEGNITDRFITTPNALRDSLPNGGFKFRAANPNTKHYITQDIFTLAVPSWAFVDPAAEAESDTSSWQAKHLVMGDTFYTNRYFVVYKRNDGDLTHEAYTLQAGDVPVMAILEIHNINTKEVEEARVLYYVRGQRGFSPITELPELGLTIKLSHLRPFEEMVNGVKKMNATLIFEVKDKTPKREYVVVQALVFPGIQLVWWGCMMMMFGLLFSGIQRVRSKNLAKDLAKNEAALEEMADHQNENS